MLSGHQTLLRELPAVDTLMQLPTTVKLVEVCGRSLTIAALREVLDAHRQAIMNGREVVVPTRAALVEEARERVELLLAPTLKPIINATGIIVHTNLGRAPLSQSALAAVTAVAEGYATLEFDLEQGGRGSRAVHAEQKLRRLLNTEAALAVNNNAAAVLLMLTALCQGKEVIISRGQLVEIGGGFRVPEVMAQSGARLVEVGTTNRTHLRDYAAAITENTAAILVAHHSNYKIVGFTTEPTLDELAGLAHARNILLLYDQGSGALLDVAPYGLDPEPTVPDGLTAGADVVAFSGDKLLGGPQAGILCGRTAPLQQIKRHPLARAVRADKLGLAALSATLDHYLKEEVTREVPVWCMLSRPLEELDSVAHTWAAHLQEHGLRATVIDGESRVGGGSLPGTSLPTKLVAIEADSVADFAARLRLRTPGVVGRVQNDRLLLDPRTVLPFQVEPLLRSILAAASRPVED